MDRAERHKAFYFIIAIVGMILMILQINIYRQTIIPFKIPLLVTLVVTLFGYLVILNDYRKTYPITNFFFPLLQSLVSFGFTACYILMALNYYYADTDIEKRTFKIVEKSSLGTRNRQPTVKIDYDGIEKELVFYTTQQENVDTSQEVILTIKKGLLGFDIFSDIQLK